MIDNKISNTSFCFIDTETTGLCPERGARICEIGLIKIDSSRARQKFSSLINPQQKIPVIASRIHGITNEMVSQKPIFSDLAERIISFTKDSVLVFHNADFDVPFLSLELLNSGLSFPKTVILDTLKYARTHGEFKSNTLGNIASELGVSNDGWHRALADAFMTEKIFFYFLEKFKTAGITTLKELIELQTSKNILTGRDINETKTI